MAEYIDREKLIKRIQYTKMSAFVPNCDEPIISDAVYKQGQAIKKIITEFRAADVVKVVRCKDCKHSGVNENHKNKPLICFYTMKCGTVEPNCYCSNGERKEEMAE